MADEKKYFSFSVDLWDQFDAVIDYTDRGRQDCDALVKFLKDRADNEANYSKALTKKNTPDLAAPGSTLSIWDTIRQNTAETKEKHLEFSALCRQIATTIEATSTAIKKGKKDAESKVNKVTKDKESKEKACHKAFDNYSSSITKAENAYDAHRESCKTANTKIINKAQKELTNATADVDKRYTNYGKAVLTLKAAQQKYFEVLKSSLTTLQAIDANRLIVVQQEMKKFANGHIALMDDSKASCEKLHVIAELAEPEQDTQDFIFTVRSVPFEKGYTEYYGFRQLSSTKIGHGPQGQEDKKDEPKITNSTELEEQLEREAAAEQSAKAPPPPPSSGSAASSKTAEAVYDYESEQPDDLTFATGDIITLDECDPTEDWWKGHIGDRIGIFPANYVQLRKVRMCKALFDFQGAEDDELTFAAGDEIEITGDLAEWYMGKNAAGETGIFPENFVELL